ncbi:MAG: ribosome biogenesis GTP-binding protein YihA/YsxC [Flavobacteriaceae bacterium]
MRIKDARFVVSNSRVAQCPNTNLPEFAFIGRSNVGKSSLINMLTDRKQLAKTSGKPGKTQLINHFLINNQWHLVDLPGYGYARVSKKDKKEFQQYITDYFLKRTQLVNAFLLIDIRHEPQDIDLAFMEWMGTQQIPFSIIFTKADKLSERTVEPTVAAYLNTLLEGAWAEVPPHFVTSSTAKIGKDAVLAYIETLL